MGPPEIQALDDTMTTMAVQLDGLLSTHRAFVADASHQLRTPLTALRLRLENLQSHLADDERPAGVDDEVERAIDETGRLTELVTNLLQLARADDQPADGDGGSPIARPMIASTPGRRWPRSVGSRSSGRVGDGDPVVVRTVPGAIEQILDNVLDNALLVSPPARR